jgi:hypothetical protein
VIKKMLSSFFDLLADCRKADVPDKKTKTGAQKWVIQRVKKSMGVVVLRLRGLSVIAAL